MSDSKGGMGSFPWASAAVLVAFVASTQLVPHAFEPLRPAEKARAQAPLDPDLELNARLWEDPFTALRRHEAERAERCDRLRKQLAPGKNAEVGCRDGIDAVRNPVNMLAKLDGNEDKRLDDAMVLIGLLPGGEFVGAEEARRRIRYATLAGLMAQDYVPNNAERLSLLEFQALRDPADPAASTSGGGLVVPYEILTARQDFLLKPDAPECSQVKRYSRIALLWVDENSLPHRKLDSLARIANQLVGEDARKAAGVPVGSNRCLHPRLGIIGPSSTDALRVALVDLRCAADRQSGTGGRTRCAGAGVLGELDKTARDGYQLLSRAEFYNATSTAPTRLLPELEEQKLEAFVDEQFNRITRDVPKRAVSMTRTIGTDNDLIERLIEELLLRLSLER
jgi:hypothetical protein